jgi:hypothetical protein
MPRAAGIADMAAGRVAAGFIDGATMLMGGGLFGMVSVGAASGTWLLAGEIEYRLGLVTDDWRLPWVK